MRLEGSAIVHKIPEPTIHTTYEPSFYYYLSDDVLDNGSCPAQHFSRPLSLIRNHDIILASCIYLWGQIVVSLQSRFNTLFSKNQWKFSAGGRLPEITGHKTGFPIGS